MILEVIGAGFHNHGAALMLHAVRQHYQPNAAVRIASTLVTGGDDVRPGAPGMLYRLPPWRFRPAELIAPGLRQHVKAIRSGGVVRYGESLLKSVVTPEDRRRMAGPVRERDVDHVLDVSGFAYGDQWSVRNALRMAVDVPRWKRQGKRMVFLPQAFGPFRQPRGRELFKRVLEHTDLLFARDRESLEYVEELVGKGGPIRLAPDFTNLVSPAESPALGSAPIAAIVPNRQMMCMNDRVREEEYLRFLHTCIDEVSRRALKPMLLLHCADDRRIVAQLQKDVPVELEIVESQDPLFVKGVLKRCSIVIASRFHAIVNSLSQAVPTIGTSWSHKYEALFADYCCPECLLPLHASRERIGEQIATLVNEPSRSEIRDRLLAAGREQVAKVQAMWQEVDRLVFGQPRAVNP